MISQQQSSSTARINPHQQSFSELVTLHIFGHAHASKEQSELIDTLDASIYPFEYHIGLEQLYSVRKNVQNTRHMVLLLTSIFSEQQIQSELFKKVSEGKNEQKVHLYTYPNPILSLGITNLNSPSKVMLAFDQIRKQKRKTLRLAGIHSIDKTMGSSKSITKISTNHVYETIKYYKSSDYEVEVSELYVAVANILKEEPNCQMFSDMSKVLGQRVKNKDKKILIVAPMDIGKELLQAIHQKNKNRSFEVLLIGTLDIPHVFYLDPFVVLATNDPAKVYQFFSDKQILSVQNSQIMQRQLLDYKNLTVNRINTNNNNNINYVSQFESGLPQGNTETVRVDQNTTHLYTQTPRTDYGLVTPSKLPSQKPKVKKLKSATKSKLSLQEQQQLAQQQLQQPQQQLQQPRQQLPETTTNMQSTPNIKYPQQIAKVTPSHGYNTTHELNYQSEGHASTHPKHESNSSRYRHPSNIIHEVSEEYRGSNKESMVNYQSSVKNKSAQRGELTQPLEEHFPKTVVNNHSITYNQPETYYQSSQTIQEEVKLPSSGNYSSGQTVVASHYQSPTRIVRKQTTNQPEEVKTVEEARDASENADIYPFRRPTPVVEVKPADERNLSRQDYSSGRYQSPVNSMNINGSTTRYQTYNNRGSPTENVNASTNYNKQANPSSSSSYTSPYRNQVTSEKVEYNAPTTTAREVTTTTTTTGKANPINLEGYERVETNGVTMYRKIKTNPEPIQTASYGNTSTRLQLHQPIPSRATTTTTTILTEDRRDASPQVSRYQVSPRRDMENYRQELSKRTIGQAVPQIERSSYYNNSITPIGERKYDVGAYSSTYSDQKNGNAVSPSYQVRNGGLSSNAVSSSTYRPDDRFTTGVTYAGSSQPKVVEVQRHEYREQKLEAKNSSPKSPHGLNQQQQIVVASPKAVNESSWGVKQTKLDVVSPSSRALNESNWMTRPSDLHSDVSTLRKNNIRFGIKAKKHEESQQSVMQSKLVSGIYTVKDLNKRMALHRKLSSQDQLLEEEQKYIHINPSITAFHYLFQEDLKYFHQKLGDIISDKDKVDYFSGLEDLVQKSHYQLDCGLIMMSQKDALKINPNLLPENYYIIKLKSTEAYLQINQYGKVITMDELQRLPLARKIILDKKLYQYVLYRNNDVLLEEIGRKFDNTEFIVEKNQVELSEEYLECYYDQMPQLTRLYVICKEKELKSMVKTIEQFHKNNPAYDPESLKILCLTSSALITNTLKAKYPWATFFTQCNSLSYKDIIAEVHKKDKQSRIKIRHDLLFLHQNHGELAKEIETVFPKRFKIVVYQSISEINRIMKPKSGKWCSYLVLHESVAGEKITVENYTKVFMMGRAKTIPNKVARVLRKEQLIELLKK